MVATVPGNFAQTVGGPGVFKRHMEVWRTNNGVITRITTLFGFVIAALLSCLFTPPFGHALLQHGAHHFVSYDWNRRR
jgi:hypothetical protein